MASPLEGRKMGNTSQNKCHKYLENLRIVHFKVGRVLQAWLSLYPKLEAYYGFLNMGPPHVTATPLNPSLLASLCPIGTPTWRPSYLLEVGTSVLKGRMHPLEDYGIRGSISFSTPMGWRSQGPQNGQAQGCEWLSGVCIMWNHEIRAQKGKELAKRHTANGSQCSDFLPMLFLLLLRHEKEIWGDTALRVERSEMEWMGIWEWRPWEDFLEWVELEQL